MHKLVLILALVACGCESPVVPKPTEKPAAKSLPHIYTVPELLRSSVSNGTVVSVWGWGPLVSSDPFDPVESDLSLPAFVVLCGSEREMRARINDAHELGQLSCVPKRSEFLRIRMDYRGNEKVIVHGVFKRGRKFVVILNCRIIDPTG